MHCKSISSFLLVLYCFFVFFVVVVVPSPKHINVFGVKMVWKELCVVLARREEVRQTASKAMLIGKLLSDRV